jgi:hypothetical protein
MDRPQPLEAALRRWLQDLPGRVVTGALDPARLVSLVEAELLDIAAELEELPARIEILVAPADYRRLSRTGHDLAVELAAGLRALGRRLDRPNYRPEVRLRADPGVRPGEPEVRFPADALELTQQIAPAPAPQGLIGRLHIRAAEGPSWSVAVDRLPFTIGRSPEADLVLAEPSVSRKHCQIRPGPEALELVDLSSLNGTWVEGRRVTRARLTGRTEFQVGPYRLRFEPARADG